MNEHDSDQPEEIDAPEPLAEVESTLPETAEGGPDAGETHSDNIEACASPGNQAEPSDEEISRLVGFGSTLRALKSAANKNPQRDMITDRADHIPPRKLHWLWPERIPLGKVTVFAGLPGQGKSLATVDIAARLTTGNKYLDSENPLPASEIWFVAGEDDPEDALVPRLLAAGADLSKVHIQNGVRVNGQDDSLRLDVDMGGIKRFLDDHPGVRLIVFDPISNHLGEASMLDEQEVREILAPLKGIATAHNLAIIAVMHLNKKEGLSAIHRVGGAGAFIGAARASWLFAPDKETQSHLMMPLKNNYARDSTSLVYRVAEKPVTIENDDVPIPCIEWLNETDVDVDEVLSAPRKPRSVVAKTFLKTLLAKGPQEATAVYDAAGKEGISERTLDRAKAELGVESVMKGDAWEWTLGGNR